LPDKLTAQPVPTEEPSLTDKPSTTLPGTVEKIIPSPDPSEPEKAQIAVEGADHLYREIRIENTLTDENGDEVSLKPGARVDVTVEADATETTARSSDKTSDSSAA
jgi:hypothetical protein